MVLIIGGLKHKVHCLNALVNPTQNPAVNDPLNAQNLGKTMQNMWIRWSQISLAGSHPGF